MATIQEKPLARRNPNNPQIREYIDAIERGKDTLHIFSSGNGWKLKKIGGADMGVFATEKEALSTAEGFLRSGTSAEVITHDANGLITDRMSYSETILPADDKRGF